MFKAEKVHVSSRRGGENYTWCPVGNCDQVNRSNLEMQDPLFLVQLKE